MDRASGLLAMALVTTVVLGADFGCVWQDPASGATYDLRGLQRAAGQEDYRGRDSEGNDYRINVCAPAVAGAGGCTERGYGMCSYRGGAFYSGLGIYDRTVEWGLLDPLAPEAGVKLTFRNGDRCVFPGGGAARTTILQLNCPGPTPAQLTVQTSPRTCTDTIILPSNAGCPVSPAASPSLSGGWYFIIALSIAIPAYLVLGCCWKHFHKGTRGIESCPHIDFWSALPSLVAAGCRTSYILVTSGCRRTGRPEEYWDEL